MIRRYLLSIVMAASTSCLTVLADDSAAGSAAAIGSWLSAMDGPDQGAAKLADQQLFKLVQTSAGTAAQHEVAAALVFELSGKHTADTRRQVCRLLGYLPNDKDVVAALIKAMDDNALAEDARAALVRLPDQDATQALIARLAKGDDATRMAIIVGLGQKADAIAVPALIEQSASPSEALRKSAWHALAQIPSPQAVPAFTKAVTENKDPMATAELLDFADVLVRAGKLGEADKIAKLRKQAGPLSVQDKCKMLRVHARLGTPESISLVLAGLDDTDPKVHGAALEAAAILPSTDFTHELTRRMDASKDQVKLELLEVLGKRGKQMTDATVFLMYKAMIDPDEKVRIACVRATEAAEIVSTVPTMLNYLRSGSAPLADACAHALAHIPGDAVTQQVSKSMATAMPALKLRLLQILASRKDRLAGGAISRATSDSDAQVRVAAYLALPAVLGDDAYDPLLGGFEQKAGPDRDAAEKAMMNLTSDVITAKLLVGYFDVADAQKPSMLRVLAPRQLAAIDALFQSESESKDEAIRTAAIAGLKLRGKAPQGAAAPATGSSH